MDLGDPPQELWDGLVEKLRAEGLEVLSYVRGDWNFANREYHPRVRLPGTDRTVEMSVSHVDVSDWVASRSPEAEAKIKVAVAKAK